ncbi:Hypothetical protein, putative [Bodo saltans]|uniref:Uncharacterized protein n=1 Tax=Bodo saltans TaxID=75058 RepID=A0A0S4JVJ4_BODSA|nr:Hypothetical protein, putative [Bodo saltans]|eukprot:CUG94269.1 Hypothetical protein, putative [Bodo saltans]
MPVDIKSVDPAIVKVESKQDRARPKPQGPVFVSFVQIVSKTEEGFNPAVTNDTHIVFHTSDDKYASVARGVASKTPLSAAGDVVEFPYTAEALVTIVHWCEKFGTQGSSETQFALPVTHTDLNVLLTSEWEKSFNNNILSRHDGADILASSIIAAEGLKLNGLLDFLIVALGCSIRGKSDHDILATLHDSKTVEDDEISAAKKKYVWLEGVTTPKTA